MRSGEMYSINMKDIYLYILIIYAQDPRGGIIPSGIPFRDNVLTFCHTVYSVLLMLIVLEVVCLIICVVV